MKNLKKVTAVALSLAMTMAAGMTSMAAGSATPGDVPETKIETIKEATAVVTDKDGNEIAVDIKVEELKEDSPAMAVLQDQEALKEKIAEAKISVGEGKEVKNVKVLVVGELKADNLPDGTVSVTISVPGEEDGPVVVLHQKDDGTWEVVEAELKDGQVTAVLDGLSPVAVARLEVGEQKTEPNQIPNEPQKPQVTAPSNTATTENSNVKDASGSAVNSGSRSVTSTRRVSPKTGA